MAFTYNKYSEKLQFVNTTILNILESGNWGKWVKEWSSSDGDLMTPSNPLSHAEYRGGNRIILACTMLAEGYENNIWATSAQLKQAGLYPTSSSKGQWVTVFFPNFARITNEKGEQVSKLVGVRPHSLVNFNTDFVAESKAAKVSVAEIVAQHRAKYADVKRNNTPIEHIEHIIDQYLSKTGIKTGVGEPSYSPALDRINMPNLSNFSDEVSYYSTFLHECGHSTGHEKRLNRLKSCSFGSEEYAKEELIAELFSVYASSVLGLEYKLENHANYLGDWSKGLRGDAGYFISAANKAEHALSYFLRQSGQYASEVTGVMEEEKVTA